MDSKELAWKIRRDAIEMTYLSKGSHIGPILSVADIIAVLYSDILKYDAKNPNFEDRDRVILSKGHAGGSIYAALAEVGFFDREILKTHYSNGSILSGHVSHKGVPGVEFSTGSLGHGMPVGAGIAMAAKKDNKNYNVFVIVGDGECNEGSIWESALFASNFNLSNLVVIVDHNKMQCMDFCDKVIKLNPFADKWKSFGWNVLEIDGHNHDELKKALLNAKENKEGPTVVIANTVKGKGISFMENNIKWHGSAPKEEDYIKAASELENSKPQGVEWSL